MLGHDDQRSYYRMMINAECVLVLSSAATPIEYKAVCRDLSSNGMAVELDQAIDLGAQVNVVVNSASHQIPSLTAKGKVLRCTKETHNSYVIGIEITELI